MSSIVVAHDVSYELADGRELFNRLNFSLNAGLTALVGPNGVGKTILARLLAGELQPAHGVVRRHAPVALFAQRAIPPDVQVGQWLAETHEWSLLRERLLQGIDREISCRALSGGQWMRVRLARAIVEDFLILDEPTNDLDREGRELVAQFIRARRAGALLISHDRELLESCADFLELSHRGLAKFSGGWSAYLDARQHERDRLAASLDGARRDRDRIQAERSEQNERQEKRNRRGAQAAARGGQPRILLGGRKRRAQETTGRLNVAALERAEAAVREVRTALDELKIDPVMYADIASCSIPAQKLVAEAHGFNVRFRDWIYAQDLDFAWRGNVRVALRGANGAGKSVLLRALLGDELDTRGEWRRAPLATLFVDQRCSVLDDDRSVFDNVRAVSSATDSELRNGLARFLFAGDRAFQPVRQLSGGERLRAALARGFLSTFKPELMVLDEPTNNLDLANIEFLEAVVRRFDGAVVVVSHDERFLKGCELREELSVSAGPSPAQRAASPNGRGEEFPLPKGEGQGEG
jgi:ATPase subunit of ABC transporter with duplicated ATPase domains